MSDRVIITEKGGTLKRLHVKIACSNCGKDFLKPFKNIKKYNNHYCSNKCCTAHRSRKIATKCGYCSTSISVPPNRLNTKSGLVFCSRTCSSAAKSRKSGILVCGPVRTSDAWDYKNIALAAYGSKCEWCGDRLLLDVHHIDHDRNNAKVGNLIVLCVYCHALETRGIVSVGSDRKMVLLSDHARNCIENRFIALGVDPAVIYSSDIAAIATLVALRNRQLRHKTNDCKCPPCDELLELSFDLPVSALATRFDVSVQTIYNWFKKYNINVKGVPYWTKKRHGYL